MKTSGMDKDITPAIKINRKQPWIRSHRIKLWTNEAKPRELTPVSIAGISLLELG